MIQFTVRCEELIEHLHDKLQEKERIEPDFSSCTNACINICRDHLGKLRELVIEHGFPDEAAEIRFFKKVKPAVLSQLIFHRKKLNLYLDTYPGGAQAQAAHLAAALQETTQFFEKNHVFYNYYRAGGQQIDKGLFLRGQLDMGLFRLSNYDIDPVFSTGYDSMIAEFMAHEMFVDYVNNKLAPEVGGQKGTEQTGKVPILHCTITARDVVELAYAFFCAGICGNKTIKEVIRYFSIWFGIDVKAANIAFNQLRNRKINKTKFLDILRNALNKYMEQLSP